MMPGLAGRVPPVLRARCAVLAVADAPGEGSAGTVVSEALVAEALARFAAGFRAPDPLALASLWSIFYLDAVLAPAAAALLCCDLVLPVALDAVGLDLDRSGLPARVWLRDGGRTAGDGVRRFAPLLREQLAPFVALLDGHTGLAPAVLWSNAAVLLDYVVGAVGAEAVPAARAEALALLAGGDIDAPGLALPYRPTHDGGRERRICCGRLKLSGMAPCPAICPGRDAFLGLGRGGTTLARGGRSL